MHNSLLAADAGQAYNYICKCW